MGLAWIAPLLLTHLAADGSVPQEAAAASKPPVAFWAGVGGVTEPTPRRRSLQYPEEARKAKLGASLVIQALVRRDGSIEVEKLLGCRVWKWGKEPDPKYATHCPELFQAIKKETELGTYHPALLDGRPVDARFAFISSLEKSREDRPAGAYNDAERLALLPAEARSSVLPVRPGAALPPVGDTWVEVRTKNFTVLANTSVDPARRVGERLEMLREVLRRLHGGSSVRSPRPTRVYLFRDNESFAPYTIGSNTGGYFIGSYDGNYIALCSSLGSTQALYHEYLHYFLANNTPHIPLWLNEGIAELYSTFAVREGQVEIGLPLSHHRETLRKQRPIALEKLFAVTTSSEAYNEAERKGVFYAESWALAHYFIFGQPELRPRLVDYLERLGRGEDVDTSFGAAFGMTHEALAAQLDAYIRQGSFPSTVVRFEDLSIDPQAESRRLSRAELLARLGILLVHADRSALDGPAEYFRSALELEPELALAHCGKGLLLLAQGDRAAALTSLATAIRLDPRDGLSRLVRAMFLLDDGTDAVPDIAVRAEAEQLLREAVELEPERGDSHRWLGRVLAINLSCEEGPLVLKRAWQMMPSDLTIAGDLARLLGYCGDAEKARYIVDTFLVPHATAQEVRDLERFLDSGEVAARPEPLLEESQRLAESGEHEKALALARQVQEALAAREQGAGRSTEGYRRVSVYIDHLEVRIQTDRAAALARAGDVRRAIGLLDEAERRLTSLLQAPDTAFAEHHLTGDLMVVQAVQVSCWDALYEQAVKAAVSGDHTRAVALVREVIAHSPDPKTVESARKALGELLEVKAP